MANTFHAALNDNALRRLHLRLPLRGAWVADCLHVSPGDVPAAGAAAVITLGSQTFVGTVVRVSQLEDLGWDCQIVGGAGRLSTLLPVRQYVGPAAQLVLAEALSDAGESPTTSVVTATLPSWRRPQRTLGQELDAICDALSLALGNEQHWRIEADGVVQVGAETWVSSTLTDYDPMEDDASEGRITIGSEDPIVLPGETLRGMQIALVVHRVEPDSTRTDLYDTDPSDSMRALFEPVDLLACYEYQVLTQNADATLELRTTDSRLPDLSKVAWAPGLPGARSTVTNTARCLVTFERGDAQRPRVIAWTAGTPTTLALPVSSLLHLGATTGADFVALSTLVNGYLQALLAAITAAPVVPLDGGATFKASLIAALTTAGFGAPVTAATRVKAT